MKKGLLLALTLVALVALVLPASALSPIVNLPGIVIGDTGDIDTGGKHLFRYRDAVALYDKLNNQDAPAIDWRNEFAPTAFHVYYMTNKAPQVIKASTATAIVPEITGAELTALGSGTLPAGTKDILAGDDFFWLALVSDGANKLTRSAYDATAAVDGMTATEYGPFVGDDKPVELTLIAAETDTPTTFGLGTMSVWTIAGRDDGTTDSGGQVIKAFNFNTDAEGWTWSTYTDATYGISPAPTQTAPVGGALIHQSSQPSSGARFGSWKGNPAPGNAGLINISKTAVDANGGNIIQADCKLVASAASAANCPSYRILYNNVAYTHTGGIAAQGSGTGKIAPSAGNPKTVVVMWVPPFNMTGMTDGGTMDGHWTATETNDMRDYFMQFDIVDFVASDTGTIGLDELTVSLVSRPTALGTNLKTWGTGGVAFNAGEGAGSFKLDNQETGIAGWTFGPNATATASNLSLQLANTSGGSYKKVNVYPSASMPAWNSDKIVKHTLKLATSNVQATPTLRYLVLPQTTAGVILPFTWVDVFDSTGFKFANATPTTPPFAPNTTETVVEAWYHGQTAVAGAILTPQFDMYKGPVGTAYPSGWPNATASVTISGLTLTEY